MYEHSIIPSSQLEPYDLLRSDRAPRDGVMVEDEVELFHFVDLLDPGDSGCLFGVDDSFPDLLEGETACGGEAGREEAKIEGGQSWSRLGRREREVARRQIIPHDCTKLIV